MSSELSRVKTYNRNTKKNQSKKPPRSADDDRQVKSVNSRREAKKSTAAPALSRVSSTKRRKGGAAQAPRKSRSESSNGSNSGQTYRSRAVKHNKGRAGAGSEEELDSASTRAEKYGNRKNVISKYFTNSLFFLFLVLTAFLVYWGVKGAPPLEDLW
ncbi:hypothetical protein MUG84_05070 [Paenibacillus sp. KQZ6P-2]|uniref:Uncharacterized protein n=1 Tax=Paenibacillus mangrovi TaxID=2931978 RepID=A0A9X2B1B4_9BACL|nr:hypothetical protein [Paenibacillus mangrovi]MCJ8011116.1 hypothetical protein [Paenibacillus mangrovi]